jgi:hypothetical protein
VGDSGVGVDAGAAEEAKDVGAVGVPETGGEADCANCQAGIEGFLPIWEKIEGVLAIAESRLDSSRDLRDFSSCCSSLYDCRSCSFTRSSICVCICGQLYPFFSLGLATRLDLGIRGK